MSKTEIEADTNGLLENLERYKAFLKLAKLSKQDGSSTCIRIGEYKADREMLAYKSPDMIAMEQFRKHNIGLFNSLANAGLDPFKKGNQQGDSGGRGG